jgi:trk system potassium uptake protein TrkH
MREGFCVRQSLSPPQIIVISFIAVILSGATLLSLPVASVNGESVGFLDALFTSTSAVCVTGLVVVTTASSWTLFGKIVLLVLIQLGALGALTFFAFIITLFHRSLSLKTMLVIQASFNQDRMAQMNLLVKRVIAVTLIAEIVGAAFLTFGFLFNGYPIDQALGNGIFHAISAFCNAGFDNIGVDGIIPLRNNVLITGVISLLIISGGLGFTVWSELFSTWCDKRPLRLRVRHLSLHTKFTLSVTATLLILGTLLFLLLEWKGTAFLGMNGPQKFSAAAFQSVTLRTAGFNTIDNGKMTDASKFLACVFMLIGGSPAGTAGGFKTVTLGVIIASMLSALRGKKEVTAFGRSLPLDLLQKALTVTSALLFVVLTATITLTFTEPQAEFVDLLFEVCSAAGTVGVSAGVTPTLSNAGKIIIILCMFAGRLSPVTMVVALNAKLRTTVGGIRHPDERVIIG